MIDTTKKWFRGTDIFDPGTGTTVIEPPGPGVGHWAGALSAVFDQTAGSFYLYYRVRRPLGEGRGWQCHIARSDDGVRFSNIWTATKKQFDSESIEAGALIESPGGGFRLYVSYLDAVDRRWKIALMEAPSPAGFSPADRRVVLSGEDLDAEGVKDPYVAIVDGRYHMFVNYAPRSSISDDSTEEELHGAGNIFATAVGGSAGLAVSDNGVRFDWAGDVVSPGRHWDRLLTRIDTMLYRPPVFLLFYSGRGSVEETYEDRTGLAVSADLKSFHKVTGERPLLVSPHSTGALRYMDAIQVGRETFCYYECAGSDGSHEIRLNRVANP